AAEAGHAQAAWQLRDLHTFRRDINRQNPTKAAYWRDKAAELNHPAGLYFTYLAYRNGSAEQKTKVQSYLQQSARLGHPDAQLMLGKHLLQTDPDEARRLLTLASQSDSADAKRQALTELMKLDDPRGY